MTRILVTGAAGALGSYVPEVFTRDDLTLTSRDEELQPLDVRDADGVLATFREAAPELVLHLAAATDVDCCELEPEFAFAINAQGTENVARACRHVGAVLVYISSAAVFAGDKPEPYVEDDEPNPANVYGASKLAGEQAIQRVVARHYIVRTGWLIGGGQRDEKFVGKIVRLIDGGERHLRAVDDKLGSPTYAPDLLEEIRRLLDEAPYGLYHLVNPPPATRFDIAVAIRDLLQIPDLNVEAVSSDAFPLPAPRGYSEALTNDRLARLGLDRMRPWRDALREYLVPELVPGPARLAR